MVPQTYYKLNFGCTNQLGKVIDNVGGINITNALKTEIKDIIKKESPH